VYYIHYASTFTAPTGRARFFFAIKTFPSRRVFRADAFRLLVNMTAMPFGRNIAFYVVHIYRLVLMFVLVSESSEFSHSCTYRESICCPAAVHI